jgi:hypothetical protein
MLTASNLSFLITIHNIQFVHYRWYFLVNNSIQFNYGVNNTVNFALVLYLHIQTALSRQPFRFRYMFIGTFVLSQ